MKKILSVFLAALLTLASLPCTTALADSVTASICVSEDAYTELSDPDTPVGAQNASTITTSSVEGAKPAAATRDVYLKFDVRSYDLSTLTSAKIALNITSVANKADRSLTVYGVYSDWSESSVTWNTAPDLTEEEPITTYLQKYDKNNNKNVKINIDVTDYVKRHCTDGVISFKITSDTGATKMDSKETLNAPMLNVQFETASPVSDVTVKYLNEQGNPISREVLLNNVCVGEYSYPHDIPSVISYQGTDYVFDKTASVTKTTIEEGKSNEIILSYQDPMITPEGVFKTVVPVTEDTFAKQNDATDIFNTEEPEKLQVTMNLGSSGAAARRDGFIKFDVSDIPYTFITSARLVGYVTSATNEGERIISIYPTETNAWSEKTLNWNNAPSYTDELVAQIPVQSGTTGAWISVDITDYCRKAEGVFSFRMIADTAATVFATKDGDSFNAMALDLRYTTDENYALTKVTVNTVDTEGNDIEEPYTIDNCLVGDYYFMGTPDKILENEKGVFIYDASLSTLHITLSETGDNVITLVYHKQGENMGTSVLAEEGGWNWCSDPRAIRDIDEENAGDKTYVAYIDNKGNIKATQYDNITDTYKQVFIKEGFTADDHSNPAIFILPDHRVMVIYSRHTEEEWFYYRISENPNDISSFGEEKAVSTQGFGTVTYPTPFYMSDSPESFYLFWRGVSWHPTVARFTLPDENDEIKFETEPMMIVDARTSSSDENKRPYAKYTSNGKDKIYISYTYAHPDSAVPNTLYCSYIDITDMTLRSVTGELLTDIEAGPFKITNTETDPSIVVNRTDMVRNWNWETELDENGNPVVLYVGISEDKQSHLYYHAQWTGESWQTTYIDDGGKWFHDNTKGAEKCYSAGLCIDHNNTDVVYASVPTEGVYGTFYEIYKYVLDNGTVISKTPVTQNSSENNFRPYVVENSEATDKVYLVWLSGEYYYWTNKKDFLPSNGAVKYGYTNKVNTWSVLTGYDPTSDFESIDLVNCDKVVTDIAFRDRTVNGATVTWESSDTTIIKENGALIRPDEVTTVTVTATISFSGQSFSKEYALTVYPKATIDENLVFSYEFNGEDLYEENGQRMIRDKSQNGNDARLMGSVGMVTDGYLDLTENARDSSNGNRPKETNSYLIAPENIVNNLRSYTFIGKVKLSDTSLNYRLYDFGSGGNNSILGRLTQDFSAGIKLDGGTTQFVTADETLNADTWYTVAYSYDAPTHTTSLYLDGVKVSEGKTIETEAIDLLGTDTRNYIGRTQWWDTYYDYTARENPDLKGSIDFVSLYNTALSEEEIYLLSNPSSSIDKVEVSEKMVSVTVSNNTVGREDYYLIASYGNVVKTQSFFLLSGKTETIPITFDSDISKEGLRVFLWNKKDNLKPLCAAYKG